MTTSMSIKRMEQNEWKVPPDNTLQVAKNDMVEERPRNWLGFLIALGIVGSVMLLITIAVVLLHQLQQPPFIGRRLTIEDIDDAKLKAPSLFSQWVSSHELAYFSSSHDLVILDVNTQKQQMLIDKATLRLIGAKEFSISANRRFVLLVHDIISERLFKRTAKYTVFDLKKKLYYSLSLNRKAAELSRFQFVQWLRPADMEDNGLVEQSHGSDTISGKSFSLNNASSTGFPGRSRFAGSLTDRRNPDGGNKGVYFDDMNHNTLKQKGRPRSSIKVNEAEGGTLKEVVNSSLDGIMDTSSSKKDKRQKKNDSQLILVYENDVYLMSKPNGMTTKLTDDGVLGIVYNGLPDLTYEELKLIPSPISVSPTLTHVVIASFNDTSVSEIPILTYQSPSNGQQVDRPKVKSLKYALPNSVLPEVSLWVHNVKKFTKIKISPPSLLGSEYYLVDFGWVSAETLWVSWISRNQSTSVLTKCSKPLWDCVMVDASRNSGGPSPVHLGVHWSNSRAFFPWPARINDGSFHNHVGAVAELGEKIPLRLPTVEYDVADIVSINDSSETIYFTGSEPSDGSFSRQLYQIKLNSRIQQEEDFKCISCAVGCPRVVASINRALSHFAITCTATHLPSLHLVDLVKGTAKVLHKQDLLVRESFEKIALPSYIRRDINLSADLHASVLLTLPPGFKDDDDTLLYSLVVQILGVERLNERNADVHLGWIEYLPSAHHVAHAQIHLWGVDPTQYSSTEKMAQQLKRVIDVMLADYSFLKSDELHLWGWGSGASIAMQMAASHNKEVKCVAAINPIADWMMYNTYTAERYLGPVSNSESVKYYQESIIMDLLDIFKTTELLMVQSEQDPLSQHSSRIVQKLLSYGIHFRHVVYPNSSAALSGNRIHLLETMENFFVREECIQRFALVDEFVHL